MTNSSFTFAAFSPSAKNHRLLVADAASDYAGRVEGQGIMAQHALGDLMAANAGDPAYAPMAPRFDGQVLRVATFGGSATRPFR